MRVIIIHSKYGTAVFSSAIAAIESQLRAGEYDFDPYDMGHAKRAQQALDLGSEKEALRILTERKDYEYENFEISEMQ